MGFQGLKHCLLGKLFIIFEENLEIKYIVSNMFFGAYPENVWRILVKFFEKTKKKITIYLKY